MIPIKKTEFIIYLTLGSLFARIPTYAQDVHETVLTTGGFHQTGQTSLSWSVGECITETMKTAGFVLTSGFQQTDLNVTTFISGGIPSEYVLIYPNPVVNFVNVEILDSSHECEMMLYDLQGNLLFRRKISTPKEVLDMRLFAPGNYLIKISNLGRSQQKYFQLTKR